MNSTTAIAGKLKTLELKTHLPEVKQWSREIKNAGT